jgi:hypothetical protein
MLIFAGRILGGAGRWLSWANAGTPPGARRAPSTRRSKLLLTAHPLIEAADSVPAML